MPESLADTPLPAGLLDRDAEFVDTLLRDQRALTAVERFSRQHDAIVANPALRRAPQRYYRHLMPATPPGPHQQFAFEVDLDACSGCKACVVACHTLNGLEEHETWRRVGTLVGHNTVQHVTTACHHCEDPGCLKGCPVKAYIKDESTGVVRHLDDQCMGCKYCTMMCPYDVPQYNAQLGIVRKCDMCHQRLAAGEAPACVQACPNAAIRIRLVDRVADRHPSQTVAGAAVGAASLPVVARLAPGAPDSSITRPTTIYHTRRPHLVNAATPQDVNSDVVADSHWPLAIMLVATQAAIGAVWIERIAAAMSYPLDAVLPHAITRANTTLAVLIAAVGMAIAPLHLGQPIKAWRIFLGLRTSWLSREAVVLGAWMGLLGGAAALLWMPAAGGDAFAAARSLVPRNAAAWLLAASLPVGGAGFYCSAMIYVATERPMWRFQRTMVRFAGSALSLGLAGFAVAASLSPASMQLARGAAAFAVVVIVGKLIYEARTHYWPGAGQTTSHAARSARLVWGPLHRWAVGRLAAAAAACLLLGLAVLVGGMAGTGSTADPPPPAAAVCLFLAWGMLLAGEFAERWLYFASVVYDRMPGMLR